MNICWKPRFSVQHVQNDVFTHGAEEGAEPIPGQIDEPAVLVHDRRENAEAVKERGRKQRGDHAPEDERADRDGLPPRMPSAPPAPAKNDASVQQREVRQPW